MIQRKNMKNIVSVTLAGTVLLAGMSALPANAAPASSNVPQTKNFVNPLNAKTYRYSSEMGARCIPTPGGSTFHLGQDLALTEGSPIKAAMDGIVVKTRNGTNSLSGYIVIEHNVKGKKIQTAYYHMWSATKYVGVGSKVYAGQRIADVGNSGPSTAPHLHFEVWDGKWYVDKQLDPVVWMKNNGGIDIKKEAYLVYSFTKPKSCTYYAASQLNLRKTSATNSNLVRIVRKSEKLTSTPGIIQNNYIPVTAGNESGWAHHPSITPYRPAYITPPPNTKPPEPETKPPVNPPSNISTVGNTKKYLTTENLNLRANASAISTKLATIPKGTTVQASLRLKDGSWTKVTYGKISGWVSSEYVSEVKIVPPVTKPPVTKPDNEQQVTGTYQITGNVNFREGNNTSTKIISVVLKDTKVSGYEMKNGWRKVKVGNKFGWISNAYLKTVSVTKPPVAAKKTYTTANLNLRAGAGTEHKILTTLKQNTVVTVKSTKGTWKYVNVGKFNGWVSNSYLITK